MRVEVRACDCGGEVEGKGEIKCEVEVRWK